MSGKTSKNKDADIQKATVRTPVEKLRGKETIEHYNAVLLEKIESDIKQVIEGMETTKVELRRDICDFRAEVNERFTVVEAAIGKNSEDINNLKGEVERNSGEIKDLRTEMHEMEDRLTTKIDIVGTRLDDHESKSANIAHRAA